MKRLVLSLLFAGLCLTSVEAQQQKAQQPQKKVPHAVRTCPEITARRTEIYIPQVKASSQSCSPTYFQDRYGQYSSEGLA